jgi:hypothetical protein
MYACTAGVCSGYRNNTLTMMSTPVLDLAAAARINQEKTDASWAKV